MSSSPTTRNRFAKQGTGDNTGTWGNVLNGQAIDLIDEAMDGVLVLPVTGDVALTSINYASDQARRRVLRLTGTTSNTYTVTIPSVEKYYVVHNLTNAVQAIKAGGASALVSPTGLQLVYCDGTDCYTPTTTAPRLIGMMSDYAGLSPPSGWLLCSGQAVSRATYAALFAVTGVAYGPGDGFTTFNLPDTRGRVTAALDNQGGTPANRLTVAGSGFVANSILGGTWGHQSIFNHGHAVYDPGHAHAVYDPGHNHKYSRSGNYIGLDGGTHLAPQGYDDIDTTLSGTGISIQASGTGVAIYTSGLGDSQNIQPTLIVSKIIFTGV